jgi:AcrR family transcriptional regulator
VMALCEMIEADADRNRALTRAFVKAGGLLLPDASGTADLFAPTIRAGQAGNELRTDIDADGLALVLLDGYLGALIRWAAAEGPTPGSLHGALKTVVQVVLDGPDPSPAGSG